MIILSKDDVKYPISVGNLHKNDFDIKNYETLFPNMNFSLSSNSQLIYHYTSPNGLMGILGNQEFFFTDSQFLNDANERKDINNVLADFWMKYKNIYDSKFFDLLSSISVESYEDVIRKRIIYKNNCLTEINRKYRYFVFSTSCESDSLNMWKYYAKNDRYNGYSIGLSAKNLLAGWNDLPRGINIKDGIVIYDLNEKISIVKKCVDELFLKWCTYKETDVLTDYIKDAYSYWIYYASLFFKNECFKDEKEYRFIAIVRSTYLNDPSNEVLKHNGITYNFRIVDGTITPYLEIPFYNRIKDGEYAIQSITVSPSFNAEQKINGIQQYMMSLKTSFGGCEINASTIPLRY